MEGRSVFISYRRQLSEDLAMLVRKDLTEHQFDTFMDVENLDSGEFERMILSQIEVREHFIVLLQPGSLDRIGEEGDWLRREIAHALAHDRNVVPVIAHGFEFRRDLVLPPDVARLPSFNALPIQRGYFDEAMKRLRTRFLKMPSKPVAPPAMYRLPIVYVRGYAAPATGIDSAVDDPFYGFNSGATHVRVGGDGDPMFYQFEGPLLRLMTDEGYRLLMQGNQHQYLLDAGDGTIPQASLWAYRFYDQAATRFVPTPQENVIRRTVRRTHQQVVANGFDIESAAAGLYDLITLIRQKTGAAKVYLVAHSIGGLVARCMMQKICYLPDAGNRREPAKELVAKFFTYGTPHGGIAPDALDRAEQAFGLAGAAIFTPEEMYGYLDPKATFGGMPPRGARWDPQVIPEAVVATDDIFCLIGTDPKDYGLSQVGAGPKSDGLVRIEHAYVRGAHRAFVHKSHSGAYGELNSEEGYQNLRRFLFGRWQVRVELDGLPTYPQAQDEQWPVWQADMRLAIRGLSVVMSEQLAAHWCPVQLNNEIRRLGDAPDRPVRLVSTFLLDPAHHAPDQPPLDREGQNAALRMSLPHDGRMRYTLTLRVFKLNQRAGGFQFTNHLEQVADWEDSLIVDMGPDEYGTGLSAWVAWKSAVNGANDTYDPITNGLPADQQHPTQPTREEGGDYVCRIPLPRAARALPILGEKADIKISVHDRQFASARLVGQSTSG